MPRKARAGNPNLAVGYVRRSTSRQDLTPAAQSDAMTRWAAEHGVELLVVFMDTVSGSTPTESRAGWASALEATRALGAGIFLVAKRDRIGRDAINVGLAGRAVMNAGGNLTSADGAGNGNSAADAFMRSILDAAAQYELACIRTRTRDALAVKRARGEWSTPIAPYGFRAEGRALVADAGEQSILVAARAHREAGLSLQAICNVLTVAGMLNRKGKPFARETMWAMLRRDAVSQAA